MGKPQFMLGLKQSSVAPVGTTMIQHKYFIIVRNYFVKIPNTSRIYD